jgi:hypothetical protein
MTTSVLNSTSTSSGLQYGVGIVTTSVLNSTSTSSGIHYGVDIVTTSDSRQGHLEK